LLCRDNLLQCRQRRRARPRPGPGGVDAAPRAAMSPPPAQSLNTAELCALIERVHAGDAAALDELLRRCAARLERMASKMLRRFPRVREHEQTGDVIQEAMTTFVTALRQLHFSSTRDFYGLAAEHVRRRLLDLARRFAGPRGAVISLDAAGGAERIAAPVEDEEL